MFLWWSQSAFSLNPGVEIASHTHNAHDAMIPTSVVWHLRSRFTIPPIEGSAVEDMDGDMDLYNIFRAYCT